MTSQREARTEDGVSIAFDVEGDGPTVVLVHGLGDDRMVWAPLRARLSPKYRTVALDLRGHGVSGAALDYEGFGLERDVHAVLAAIDAHEVMLVGHSLGGFVVSLAAGAPKVRGIINVDQPLALAPLGETVRAMRGELMRADIGKLLWRVLEQLGLGPLSPSQRAALLDTRSRIAREVVLGAWAPLLADDDAGLAARIDARLSTLHVPYVSVHGCDTPSDYFAWLRMRVPQAEMEVWTGMGHGMRQGRCRSELSDARGYRIKFERLSIG